ncbi:MAG: hypothetical protein IT430_02485 [Phycisphaerales bacterium]|nr:hypothetical protein [Phycisphaerales bacterium]
MESPVDHSATPAEIPLRGWSVMLAALLLMTGCSWEPVQIAPQWIQWSPAGDAVAIESRETLLLADRQGDVICGVQVRRLAERTHDGAGRPTGYYYYRWLWSDAESLAVCRWTSYYNPVAAWLDILRFDLTTGTLRDPMQYDVTDSFEPDDRILSMWQPGSNGQVRVLSARQGAGSNYAYSIVDLPSGEQVQTFRFRCEGGLLRFDPATGRLWWLAPAEGDDWTKSIVMSANISLERGVIEGPFACGALPGGRPETFLLPQDDGSLLVRLLYPEGRTESGVRWRLLDMACDSSASALRVVAERSFEGPTYTNDFAVNPAATQIAYFRDKGELVVRSLVDGAERTATFSKPSWIREYDRYLPIDGRAMQPVWLDDTTLCSLWPSEAVRDRLEIVLWNVAADGLVPSIISAHWPEEVRPTLLEVRYRFNATL